MAAAVGKCLICMCISAHVVQLPCGHSHCRDCLKRNIQVSLESLPFHPVKCCGKSGPGVTVLAGVACADDVEKYREMLDEYEANVKLYCSVQLCSAFIPSSLRTGAVATCPKCKAETCEKCERPSHGGEVCATNAEDVKNDHKLWSLAREKAWQRCPECRAVVSKTDGCAHISCRCGGYFCYGCGRATCVCDRRFLIRQHVRRRRGFLRRLLGSLL